MIQFEDFFIVQMQFLYSKITVFDAKSIFAEEYARISI